jgi:hypothetical protein
MTTSSTSPRERIAHCCCGSLRAKAIGEPIFVVACFCEECVRRTGSTFGVSTYWLRENVEVSGSATRYERDCQEGRKARLYFCPTCGSTVYWDLDRRPDALGIAAGAFFDPDFPAPTASVWERSKPGWIDIPAGTHFDQNPPPRARQG